MSDQHEPIHLHDARSGADPLLRRLLQTASHSGPSPAHKHALDEAILRRAALVEAQAERAGDQQPAPHGPRGGMRGATKWLIVLGLAGTAGLGIALQSRQPEASPAATPSTLVGRQSAPPAAESSDQNAPKLSARAPAPTTLPPTAANSSTREGEGEGEGTQSNPRIEPGHARAAQSRPKTIELAHRARRNAPDVPAVTATSPSESSASTTTTVAVSPGDRSAAPLQTSVAPELDLLARAQRALRDDPEQAIELANLHARAYPTGAFSEEREAITIEALIATGQVAQAQQRGRAFLSRHKSSAYGARVARLLQANP